ncbi:Zn(II)2Cys6 transcription factor [Aspergillus fijiensis CBS 313.89]|uniref:Zn(2)-C6 fungal-type domain-containing protein n=1 Tax=Aspergillus fijiensis CBS 313.89 TaxID=1448319 RepID=A0A8G1W5I6_9EURO|nr:uncharacterized protein BO72DRAFT_421639 [Aspergillus fijiensis CBS 313.89]RAK81259.1 hypothetical protein BO72DRAFT_421639 [Aspergillus fijiensis CBS 313.89]
MAEAEYPYDTRLVSELLRDKRRTRSIRSCFPCRHRKVRCNGQTPCSSCVKRSHPELCRMPTTSAPARSAIREPEGQSSPRPSEPEPGVVPAAWHPAAAIARLEAIERQIGELKASFQHIAATGSESYPGSSSSPLVVETSSPAESESRPRKAPGQQVVEEATGATIFLGRHADFPRVLGCREPQMAQEQLLQDAMMDDGGVPRAYPFTGLWGLQATTRDVCETLPDDEDILRYWQTYQTTAYPFYPVLVSIDEFGAALMDFLHQRTRLDPSDKAKPDEEPESSWLALLFAVLACAVQFADDPIQERDLRSRVFLCSSFHCLRLSNFFSQTNLEQIQAMALIGHCLRNNLDTNSAWILMGATMRLAQSIGLHDVPVSVPPAERPRWSRLWWTLIQQDCFLSFTYDRPPSALPATSTTTPLPCLNHQAPKQGGLTFQSSSLRICQLVLNQQPVTTPPQALTAKDQFLALQNSAARFLTDKRHCTSLQQHLERLAFQIHLGYVICRMYRLHLDLSAAHDPAIVKECTATAARVVAAFLDLYRLSKAVCRSWAFVHNAVSCAVTLRGLGVHRGQAEVDGESEAADDLVQRLVGMLQLEARGSEWCDEDTNRRHFGPYSRALRALLEVEGGREGDRGERMGFE